MELRIPPRRRIASDLRSSTIDGCCFSSMVGLGETYFVALYLAIGFGATSAAWLATLPIFVGSLFQLATPTAISLLGSWKRWTVFNAALQSFSLFLMAGLVASGYATFFNVFLVASLYFGSGQATAPSWNMWVEQLIPRSIRTRYLTGRQRASQICLLIVVILASVAFRLCQLSDIPPTSPLFVFLVCAGVFRAISTWQLSCQSESPDWFDKSRIQMASLVQPNPGPETSTRLFSRLLSFLVLMQFAVYISSAFFTPYKIKMLEFDYAQFSVLVIMSYIGKVSSLGLAGRLAVKWGAYRLLLFGALGIVPMAGLWSVSTNFYYLAMVQFCSGLMWACYELAMVMVFVEMIPRNKRLRYLSRYNVANSAAMVLGTAVGAALFAWFGQAYLAYIGVFICSSVCRLLVISTFPWQFGSTSGRRETQNTAPRSFLFSSSFEQLGRSILRPWQSMVQRPTIDSHQDGSDEIRKDSAA